MFWRFQNFPGVRYDQPGHTLKLFLLWGGGWASNSGYSHSVLWFYLHYFVHQHAPYSYFIHCLLGLWKCALFLHASILHSSHHYYLCIVMPFRGTSPFARSQALQLSHPCTPRTVLATCFSRAEANHFLEQSRGTDESKDLWNAIKHKEIGSISVLGRSYYQNLVGYT